MPCPQTVLGKLPHDLRHFPQELTDGGSYRAPQGPVSKMGATMRLRKSHLATACSAAHISEPGMEEAQALSSLHFSQPPARRLNPGPMKRWGRPANRQNPNPQPPVRRLIQSPAGPCFEDGCNHAVAEIPSCDRLFGGSHFRARHGGDASALFAPFFSAACAVAQSGPDEEMGSTGEPAKPSRPSVVPQTVVFERIMLVQNLTGRGGKPDFLYGREPLQLAS